MATKYFSIDIETLGTNPKIHDVIEFGAVYDDLTLPFLKLPKFHCYVLPPEDRQYYRGDPKAMALHSKTLKAIADRDENTKHLHPHQVGESFFEWVLECLELIDHNDESVDIVVAGKNFGVFDWTFINKFEGFNDRIKIHRRLIDPAMLYFDPKIDDIPPNLTTCLMRAGHSKTLKHDAVWDALDVVKCLRHKWKISH